ncbi:MAG: 30S ribosomal protein S5, partial [Planctomycetes bacterium]|nr:30S ribosomal protein S5 [Planctomycetota bacterium]
GEDFEEIVVKVKRCAKVVKGGKRFSFNALVVVGNRKGQVGWGYGKANEVPFAVEKGIQEAKKNLIAVPIVRGSTLPHEIRWKFSATEVLVRPACKGTGVKAGAAARAVLELSGVHDVLCKVFGSTNPINVVKATYGALKALRTVEVFAQQRGVAVVQKKTSEVKPPPAAVVGAP